MITVFLTGGLGNQMFQYAAGRVLSERTGARLLIDLSFLNVRTKNTTLRDYELGCFVLDKNIKVVSSKLRGLLLSKLYFNIRNTLFGKKIAEYFSIFTARESCNFDPRFSQLQHHVKLLGHFQSEKYFSGRKHLIQNSFTFKEELYGKNNELAGMIKNANAVSVHIRRGDYIHNHKAANNFVSCSKEYYEQAMAYICEKVESPYFFIFSDEPETAKKILQQHNAIYINNNTGTDSYNDMRLMSLCKHNIIANSSFSWWGAWLNNYPGKIVIAPRQWFKNEVNNNNVRDLLPQEWIKL